MNSMEPEQAARIGAQVRKARRAKEWTQAQLAEHAGVAPGTVNSIENAKPVRPGNLRAVLDALRIPPLAETPAEVDEDVRLVLDIIEKSLMALPTDERGPAVRELIRYMTLRATDTDR